MALWEILQELKAQEDFLAEVALESHLGGQPTACMLSQLPVPALNMLCSNSATLLSSRGGQSCSCPKSEFVQVTPGLRQCSLPMWHSQDMKSWRRKGWQRA